MNDPDTSASAPSASPEPDLEPQDDTAASGALAHDEAEHALPDPIPHAGARYAALRLLMLVAVGGILYIVGMRGWLLAIAAVLISGIVSLFMFMKQRNDAAVNLERTVEGWKHRHDEHDELAQS